MPSPAFRLSASFALAWGQFFFIAAFGGIFAVNLGGDVAWAGVPFLLVYLGTALAGVPAGRLMDRLGQRRVLMAGHFVTGAGTVVSAYGLAADSLILFLAGIATASLGVGTTNLTRVAAGDLYPPNQRSKGVAVLVFGAVGGIILALALTLVVLAWDGAGADVAPWAVGCVLPAAAVLLLSGLPRDAKRRATDASIRLTTPLRTHARSHAAAATALIGTHAAMGTLMAVAGATMAQGGSGYVAVTSSTGAHLVAMFLLALAWGASGDLWGTGRALRASTLLLVLSCAGMMVPSFSVAFVPLLTLVGLAWSGALVNATAAIVSATRAHERGAVLGTVDVVAALLAASGAAASGPLMGRFGLPGIAGLATAFALLALGAASMTPRRGRTTPYK